VENQRLYEELEKVQIDFLELKRESLKLINEDGETEEKTENTEADEVFILKGPHSKS
jgi:hypothetical protein